MTSVEKSVEIAAPATAVWGLVGNPAALADWHPAIVSSPLEGQTRSCTLGDGSELREAIEAHDDAKMTYTYRILSGPLPIEDYVSTLEVTPVTEGRSRLRWTSEFKSLAPEAEVVQMIGGIYSAGLVAVQERLQQG